MFHEPAEDLKYVCAFVRKGRFYFSLSTGICVYGLERIVSVTQRINLERIMAMVVLMIDSVECSQFLFRL